MSYNTQSNYSTYPHYQRKEPVVAWILWFFLGVFGGHRFYLKQYTEGFMLLGAWVFLVLILSSLFGVVGLPTLGVVCIVLVWVWWIVEAFTLNSNIRKANSVRSAASFGM